MSREIPTLKKLTRNSLYRIVFAMIVVIMISSAALFYRSERNAELKRSKQIFQQLNDVMEENQQALEKEKYTYAATCLKNARTVAYILQYHPEARKDKAELEKICRNLEIDEIHIFNKRGVIVQGTQPQYYGYSFDSGEQMAFFKPLLKDKSLELVQDLMPNTAAGKQEQYSALWSEDGTFIVEVGMHPERVLEYMEKNELPYIFRLVGAGSDSVLFSIDPKTNTISVSTDTEMNEMPLLDAGLDMLTIKDGDTGFFAFIDGVLNFCVSQRTEDGYFVRAVSAKPMLQSMLLSEITLLIAVLGVFYLLTRVVMRQIDGNVIQPIRYINKLLKQITDGQYENRIDPQRSQEFAQLGAYVNEMTESIQRHVSAIQYQSDHDVLTDTWNRNAYQHKVKDLGRESRAAGIMYADLNGLKKINDTLGHEEGDKVIISLAVSLAEIFGKQNVYRIGGDEFVVLDDEITEEELLVKQQMLHDLWAERAYSVSTGRAYWPGTGEIDEYVRAADASMYSMKRSYYEKHTGIDRRKI